MTTSATPAALMRTSPLPPLAARILLTHVLGWRRTELITRGDEPLDTASVARFRTLEARRVRGEPVAQLIGSREFFGLDFEVTPDVLIPRPETELLVETALDALARIPRPRVLDLGTGSGAIAVAIASARSDARIWAIDRSAGQQGRSDDTRYRHGRSPCPGGRSDHPYRRDRQGNIA